MWLLILHSNFDPLTETYGLSFYTQYLARWPEYFQLAESPSGQIMGYSEYKALKQLLVFDIYISSNYSYGQGWRSYGKLARSCNCFNRFTGLQTSRLSCITYELSGRCFRKVCKFLSNFFVFAVKAFTFFRKRAYFVDLFVRKSNQVAINMYQNLGYIIYRTILDYYAGDHDEDAYGMFKRVWKLLTYVNYFK